MTKLPGDVPFPRFLRAMSRSGMGGPSEFSCIDLHAPGGGVVHPGGRRAASLIGMRTDGEGPRPLANPRLVGSSRRRRRGAGGRLKRSCGNSMKA